ncbi:hypothetical protein L226DRAFT_539570 [Lentinus tigrinus ALCF2SS1-7]|uniref:uncharacterized protein n=1 Tax=Lentinus tigrinus ALCF2SS1-7 TaxID=1328758 RepID=UPI0011661E24|nr:hypothetical protein L226DRAFT_539570 [Lentinus tigrinus ALCF2SS1-7]
MGGRRFKGEVFGRWIADTVVLATPGWAASNFSRRRADGVFRKECTWTNVFGRHGFHDAGPFSALAEARRSYGN